MHQYRRVPRSSYNYGALVGGASPDAGTRQYNPLHTTAQTLYLTVRVTGLLNVAVAGTAVLNRGSIMAAFAELGLDENGVDRLRADPRALRQLAEYTVESKSTSVRAAAAGVGVTNLVEVFRVHFAHPRSMTPRETSFLPRDPKQALRLFHTLNQIGNGVGNIIQGGTATLSNVKVEVLQRMNEYESARPLFIPAIRQMSVPVAQASTELQLNVVTSNYMRGLLVQQDCSLGEVNDIINNIQLLGDQRAIIGPGATNYDLLARDQELAYGGDVYGGGNGYFYMDFQPEGRLTDIWAPGQDNNLRFVFDCQPTAKVGAAASVIRVTLVELTRDLSAKTPDGRALVDPLEIPVG